jgi:hypothetical protein
MINKQAKECASEFCSSVARHHVIEKRGTVTEAIYFCRSCFQELQVNKKIVIKKNNTRLVVRLAQDIDDDKDKYPFITFTVTTCRRLDLFFRTMHSFLDNCLDTDLITRWVVSDDHSSKDDIKRMKKEFPFLEIYPSKKKGQAASLNNLFSRVETEWFFHCEDDWEFITKDHFIRKLFDITFDDNKIKNVTLRYWEQNIVQSEEFPGLAYNVHRYIPENCDMRLVRKTNHKWYGYTLNPGLQHKPTIDLLGRYDEKYDINSRFFDRPQAVKYLTRGYKVANLLEEFIVHIGEQNSAYNGD